MKDLCIIGGGAAGLAAAICAARRGLSVTILESGEKPGRKLLKTGNGRCNLANAGDASMAYFGQDPSFANAVFRKVPVPRVLDFFRSVSIYPKNFDGLYYPHTEEAAGVVAALEKAAGDLGVTIKNNNPVKGIERKENRFILPTPGWSYEAKNVLLACGSNAAAGQDSLDILQNVSTLGLEIREFTPALVPLELSGIIFGLWKGSRIRGSVTLYADGHYLAREEGQIQLTNYGISGIPVFNISAQAAAALQDGKHLEVELDFLPDFTEKELNGMIAQHGLKETVFMLLPKGCAQAVLQHTANADTPGFLKHGRIRVKRCLSLEHAQCASGGILTEEIDPKTMEVKKIPGLYAAGEVMDICGKCGGFNLQFAFATGILAGRSVLQ